MKEIKTCFTCEISKVVEEFGWRDRGKAVRLGRCMECMRVYHQNHYATSEKRKAKTKRQTIVARQRNTRFVTDYLKEHPCVDCGFDDIRALDFDHLRDKVESISSLRFKGCAISKLQAEMDKCEVRCANCHRIITHTRRGHSILDVAI